MKDVAAGAARGMREAGDDVASTAKDQAGRYASEQKEVGAQQLDNIARAVDRAADELEGASPDLARYAHQAASSVGSFSDTLRNSSVRDLIDQTNRFARREPALFLGVSVMAGMAMSRFLRSTADDDSHIDTPDRAPMGSTARGSSASGSTMTGKQS